MVKRNVTVRTAASTDRLYEVIADLSTYPEWLDIVSSVERAEEDPHDDGPAWMITLRAQFGRMARSKRLRVVRTATVEGKSASFERRELDGRNHAEWIMHCVVEPSDAGSSSLELDLSYTGGLWSNVLDVVLGDEIEQALSRLPIYAEI